MEATENPIATLTAEGLGPLTVKAAEVGLDVSIWTLLRWVKDGAHGHRLEALRVGSRWQSTAPALIRFLEATNRPAGRKRKKKARKGSSGWSKQVLASHGLGS